MATIDETKKDAADHASTEGNHQSHLWFLEHMNRVNRVIQKSDDLEQMMRDVLSTTLAIFDCDRVWLVYPCDPDAPSFRVPMEVTKPEYPGAKALNVDIPMFPDEAQNLREALASDIPVTYVVGTDRPVNKVSVEQFGVQSQMFTAIYPKSGKPWVFGMHQCSFARVWTDAEKDLFQEIGRRLSDSLSILLVYRGIKESEQRNRLLFEHMLTGFARCEMIFDDKGIPVDFRYLEVNPMFEKLTGLKDVVGRLVTEVIPGIRETDPTLFEVYGRVATTGKAEHLEIYLEALKTWFSISVYSTERGFFVAVFDNITDDKNKEVQLSKTLNELENIIDTLPNIMYVLDTKSNLIKWNRHAEVATGYSAKELEKKLALELIPHREKNVFIEAINDAYEKNYVEIDIHLVRKDGVEIPYRWSAAPMRDSGGNDIGIIGIGWDQTERLKNEEQFKVYQAQQQVILDNVPDVIWMKDANGVYLAANTAFLARIGKQREAVIGKTDLDLWPKEYAEKYRADDAEVATSHAQKRIEESVPELDGTITWVETIKVPVYDASGGLLGVTGVARDITERKQLHEALDKQEAINEIVSDHLPIGYAVNTIADGTTVYVNKKFEEIYGWPKEILTSVDAFFDHVYPDPEFRKKIREQVIADMLSGDPIRMIWEKLPIVRQSGETAYITARNIPLYDDGLMVSTVLDVTQQVKVEKALRESQRLQHSILDTIPDLAWVKDKDGIILLVNHAFAAALQKPIEQIIGKTDYDIWDDRAMAEAFRADDAQIMASGKQIRKREHIKVPGTDQLVFAETIKMPIYNDDGSILGTTGIARIVEERS